MTWEVRETQTGSEVVPVDDLIIHTSDMDCTCAPRREIQGFSCYDHSPIGNLAIREVVVHEAMDGRE